MAKVLSRRLLLLLLVTAMIMGAVLSLFNDFAANVAFFIAGATLAIVTQLIVEQRKREELERDLAASLYEELANRIARCVFDFEAPWEDFTNWRGLSGAEVDILRLRKFMPVAPVIYPATAGQISVIQGKAPQAAIRFYSHFSILMNDIEAVARYCELRALNYVEPRHLGFLADRYRRTIMPGLQALMALTPLVPNWEQTDIEAIKSLDVLVPGHPRAGLPLRQRLEHYSPRPS